MQENNYFPSMIFFTENSVVPFQNFGTVCFKVLTDFPTFNDNQSVKFPKESM